MRRVIEVVLSFCLVAAALVGIGSVPQADAQGGQAQATPQPLFALPDARTQIAYTSSTMALGRDGVTIVAANMLRDTAAIVVPANGQVLAEVPVGDDPRNTAITPDGTRALVTNRGSGTLSVIDIRAAVVLNTIPVGQSPYGVVTDNDSLAYVALQGDAAVVTVDLSSGQVSRRVTVPGTPTGLALWGDFLYVTDFWTGEVSLIYLPTGQVAARAGSGSASVSPSIALDISRGIAYVPQSETHAENLSLTYDSAVLPLINVLRLSDLTIDRSARIAIDQADQPVNMPFAVALDRFAERLYIANAGSGSLSVIDVDGRFRGHIDVGANPRGVLLNRDNTLLYVHNVFDANIATVRTRDLAIVDRLPISALDISTDELIGTRLFYSAVDPRMSRDGWLSCANCHFDGMSDGRVWQGFLDGPRNTPVLYDLANTAPYTWSGTWDELADVESKIRWLQGGTGLTQQVLLDDTQSEPLTGQSLDLDTLVGYLRSLEAPPLPVLTADERDLALRGEVVFNEQNCASCHPAPLFTNQQLVEVGTGGSPLERLGPGFDVPALRWLDLSAPYFHDGRAATLSAVFSLDGAHQLAGRMPQQDIDALIVYLRSLAS